MGEARCAFLGLCAAAALALAHPAWAQNRTSPSLAMVPFKAEAPSPEQLEPTTVAPDEPFLVRRLTAIKSATLRAAATFRTDFGDAAFAEGARLLVAQGAPNNEYYCGPFTPGAAARWIGHVYGSQWACLQDTNGDGVFDRAFSTTSNPGSYLPSFSSVRSPIDVSVPYGMDAPEDTFFYETAYVYERTFNIYGRLFFYQKVRAHGETEWSNIASVGRGVRGGSVAVRSRPLPQRFQLGGAQIDLVGKTDENVTVDPVSVQSGTMIFTTFGG